MATSGGGEHRLKAYKLKGLDVEEVRRRKEEEGVQLRKSRREEQVRNRGSLTGGSHMAHVCSYMYVRGCERLLYTL